MRRISSEIPDNVKQGLEIRPVATVEEVLKIALTREPTPIVWEEPDEAATPVPPLPDEGAGDDAVITH